MSEHKPYGPYERWVKRPLDATLAGLALVGLSPIMAATAVAVRVKLGSPVIFRQMRPGLNEHIFELYKFRTMTDGRDEDGNLLPDEVRLTPFGAWLRSTSLDELPELFNILKGDMAMIGPRPQLVRDMVFMTKEQRRRHLVRPGLSGLAQVNGRNGITWDKRLAYDIDYIGRITLLEDARLILATVAKVLGRSEGITEDGMATSTDLGDYLLAEGRITQEEYNQGQAEAKNMLQTMQSKSKSRWGQPYASQA